MARPTKRSSLQVLTRKRLLQLTQAHELDVSRRAKHDELVDALVAATSIPFEDLLTPLSRDELKAICDAHDMDRSGKAKAPIVARILGQEPDASTQAKAAQAPPKKKASKKKASKKKASKKKAKADPSKGGVLGFEAELFSMADQLWTNSGLQPSEYSTPVLALVFLKYADHKFTQTKKALEAEREGKRRRRSRELSVDDYLARGVPYVPEEARFQTLLELPEGSDLGKAVNDAMKAIERENPELKDVLPKTFAKFERTTLASLLKIFANIPPESSGDTFGRIYEYFLGSFAPRTLQKGGEYFTPESVVKLIVEIVEPFHGRILDPACGSGGMFIQSARFVEKHQKNPAEEISVHGIEKISQTLRLTKMNLAVHGLSGDIREANTYYEDPHDCVGKFDFVMANPPFNQKAVDKGRIKDDKRRFPFGMPTIDNANALWIQLFYSALNERGRAGFIMANSASDARGSEGAVRRRLIESGAVDTIVTLSSNFFFTVTLPVTLWFLDKGKRESVHRNTILFIDAKEIFQQVSRAHRTFTAAQVEYLANIVRIYRGEAPQFCHGGRATFEADFPHGNYVDVPGVCKRVPIEGVASRDWSLTPGQYVGVRETSSVDEEDFLVGLSKKADKFAALQLEAQALADRISATTRELLAVGG